MKLTNTIVIAAPACCGKTFAANNSEYDVLDVEEEMASFDKRKRVHLQVCIYTRSNLPLERKILYLLQLDRV